MWSNALPTREKSTGTNCRYLWPNATLYVSGQTETASSIEARPNDRRTHVPPTIYFRR